MQKSKNRIFRGAYYVRDWLRAFGIECVSMIYGFRGLPGYLADYCMLRRQLNAFNGSWKTHLSMPCLQDRYAQSGKASGHYFHQDLLVARKVYERNPQRHVDVGSSIPSFVAHLAVFRKVEVFDIRPLTTTAPNIIFHQCDLMSMPPEYAACCDSLSCLHALEHFGLGRYSDRVDAAGYLKGMENLGKLLQPGGFLYLSVPIGAQRIEFNAHRVFAISTVLAMLESDFDLITFSYIDDTGDLNEDVRLGQSEISVNLDLLYGCGIFECKKR